MEKRNWKGICIGCIVMTVLVIARCIATAARELYYNRTGWMTLVLRDGWFYVGIAAALVGIISGVMWYLERKKASPWGEAVSEAD